MPPTPLEDAIRRQPFRPFEIHADGRSVAVSHPEQILLTPDKSTAVIAGADGHLVILGVDRIALSP